MRCASGFFLAILLSLVVAAAFLNISIGSIPNNDDALYAQVAREASEGAVWPLTFSGNPYLAKPPLMFWTAALFMKSLGSSEWVVRLPYALCWIGFALVVFRLLLRESGVSAAAFWILLVLGSPVLSSMSRRILLEGPLLLLTSLMLRAVLRSPRPWAMLGLWAGIGWWVKEIAILPPYVACLGALMLSKEKKLDARKALKSVLIFGGIAMGLMLLRLGTSHDMSLSTWKGIYHGTKSIQVSKQIYATMLIADHALFLLFPLSVGWTGYRMIKRTATLLELTLLLCIVFQTAALGLVKMNLPQYFFPCLFSLGMSMAVQLGQIRHAGVRLLIGLLLALQAGSHQRFQFDSQSPELDPARATKRLTAQALLILGEADALCVFDTGFVGFRFYADRPVRAYHTQGKFFEKVQAIREYKDMVFYVPPEGVVEAIKKSCGCYAIVPDPWYKALEGLTEPVKIEGPLKLIKTVSPGC